MYLQWKCFCFRSQTAHCGHMEVCGFQKNKPLFMDAEAASMGQFGVFLAAKQRVHHLIRGEWDELKAADFNLGFCHLFGDGKALDY